MELWLSVVDPDRGSDADVLVDADPATRLGELADSLGRVVGRLSAQGADGPPLHVGGVLLDPELPLDTSPVRDGAVVSVGSPAGCPVPDAQGLVEIRVVGGPDAGGVHRLGPGTAVLGGGEQAWIRVNDPDLPPAALEVDVETDGSVTLSPVYGAGVSMEGEPVTGRQTWPAGQLVALGQTLLEVGACGFPDAALKPSEDGTGLDYNRPPRLSPPARRTDFRLPARPRPSESRPLPWVMAVVPLVAAVVMVMIMHNTMFLAFAVLSPVSVLANHWSERRTGKKSYRRSLAEYAERRAALEQEAQAALLAEQVNRRRACPDPAETGLVATGPRQRLWERRQGDPDHLLLRVGTGTLESEVSVTDLNEDEHRRTSCWQLHDVPVTVSLADHPVLGVAGRAEEPRALGRWLLAQAAVLHSPADVVVCVLSDHTGRTAWDWVRWLPHARPREGQQALTLLGTDTDTVARRVSELLMMISARQEALREAGGGAGRGRMSVGPDVLVVLDGSRRLRALPGVTQILREGPGVGIRAICLDSDVRLLPEECQAVVAVDHRGLVRVQQTDTETIEDVRPDFVGRAWCERVARSLAPIRDVSGEESSALPDSARLLDVVGLEPPTPDALMGRWSAGGHSTKAVVGVSLDGPFALDLVRDGPHGLIAGTTGSGKSELLQTLVASLAVANRPDAMTFVLVDYKGGSAFKDCVRLPHTVGMVTDLDTHLVGRALTSLSAELRRREHILARAGTKDLEDYLDAMRRDPSLAPLPRLLLVIDEFASMARELPDFVTGLVNIAQRGRSLGIHLILATQRPSGVVSPEIRANTNLRIALRVTDSAESADVIDAPDAARITKITPGRAYVRLGHSSLLPFQAGRVGGRRPGQVSRSSVAPWAVPVGWTEVGQPPPGRPAARGGDADVATDLSVLVEAIREANTRLGIPPQHSPWLPPLPAAVMLDELAPPESSGGELRPAPFGLTDLPSAQARRAEVVDLGSFGHLFVAGAPRSGRSQTLRSLAGSLARANSSADVHLYGIDCGNGALLALTGLPHCGAVVRSTDSERAERLIGKLTAEMRRRMALLGEGGFTDVNEQRSAAPAPQRLSHVVVLIDRWEGFVASLGELNTGALTDAVLQMLREGASAGIHLVIAGDHTLLAGRISTLTENKLALRLADHTDYSLIGVNPRSVPAEVPPGRAYRAGDGSEVQVALLATDPSGQAQSAALAAIGAETSFRDAQVPRSQVPFRVDVLPARIDFEAAWRLRDIEPGPLWGMVAVGGDQLSALGPDLEAGTPAFVIAGPPQSGRSTALASLAASYVARGTSVVVVTPRPSPLGRMAGQPGVAAVFEGGDLPAVAFADTLAAASGPIVVLVDDAELLRECEAGSELSAICRRQARAGIGLVLAGDADSVCSGFSGWQVEAKKARRGLLLSPQNLTDADLVGARLPRALIGQPVQPGRGVLHLGGGEILVVQVPRVP